MRTLRYILDVLDPLITMLKTIFMVAVFIGILFGLIMPILYFCINKAWKMFGLL